MAVTLIPLVLGWLHATGVAPITLVQRLDDILYDARLRAFMPRTLDDRIVIIDIDEKSLAEQGRWPWGRHKLAALVDELFDRQGVAIVGFDVVFAEPDESSGLAQLRAMAEGPLRGMAPFRQALEVLAPQLDHDARFARALEGRATVLGYYLSSDVSARTSGRLPQPVLDAGGLGGRPLPASEWAGYGANLDGFMQAAASGGFVNAIPEIDGVVRSMPLLARHGDQYYESLALAV